MTLAFSNVPLEEGKKRLLFLRDSTMTQTVFIFDKIDTKFYDKKLEIVIHFDSNLNISPYSWNKLSG